MSRHTPICPCCGQVVELPKDFRHLQLNPSEVLVIRRLWKSPLGVAVEMFSVDKKCLQVYISRIRQALRETGSTYKIASIRDSHTVIGYRIFEPKNAYKDHAA